MNKVYKVNYRHVEQGDNITEFLLIGDVELKYDTLDSIIKDFLFNAHHKYHTVEDENGERSHGTFTYSYKEVSRQDDDDINKDIARYKTEIELFEKGIRRHNKRIDELYVLLRTPYIEYDTDTSKSNS